MTALFACTTACLCFLGIACHPFLLSRSQKRFVSDTMQQSTLVTSNLQLDSFSISDLRSSGGDNEAREVAGAGL